MRHSTIIYVLGTITVSIILLFAISSVWVSFTVANTCKQAQETYQKDKCVDALLAQVSDDQQQFGNRNDAIWALGQLGDTRALPTLRSYYTGIIPQREPWHETMSQYELGKAINLLEGGFNITVLFRALPFTQVKE